MVFSSITFLLYFLPVFLLVYYLVPYKFKNVCLLTAGLLFYSWGAPDFLPILLLSCVADFFISLRFKSSNAKYWLILSIVLNVLLLLYFKYANFLFENINELTQAFRGASFTWTKVILPIGISFLTFQKISYMVDVYRKDCEVQHSFVNYLLFITLFPHSIAGPIVRYKDIHLQITNRFSFINTQQIYLGLFQFVIGLSKKVLLANTLGAQADVVFNNMNTLSFTSSWMGILCYTLQIYFDFSGYSDMAIGLGKMMGFKIPENFRFPYTAKSITEFWKRWHITLSSWMKDYLYIPLGGNKLGINRTYFNLFFVFLISGFWHGASWSFLFWGAFHGTFLVLERLFLNKFLTKIGAISMFYTLLVVMIGWVFFRVEHFQDAIIYLNQMAHFSSIDYSYLSSLNQRFSSMLFVALFFSFQPQKIQDKLSNLFVEPTPSKALNYTFMLAMVFLYLIVLGELFATGFNPFIYFKF